MQSSDELPSGAVTREELHRLVWQRPIADLAAKFGIESKRLVGICNELNIPYPRPRYWIRKRNGQRVADYQLPKNAPGTPDYVIIRSSHDPASKDASRSSSEPKDVARAQRSAARLHPIISLWHEERAQQAARFGILLPDWSACDLRRQKILDHIFRAVEEKGLKVEPRKRLTSFCVIDDKVQINCCLREKKERVREHKQEAESVWPSLRPSGKLVFIIENYLGAENSIRREWHEKKEPFETMIPKIVGTIIQASPILLKLKEQEEERTRQRYEIDRLRREEEARKRTDDARWHTFVDIADRVETTARLHRLIEMIEQMTRDPSAVIGDLPISEWLQWAKSHVQTSDPLSKGVMGVFEELASVTDFQRRSIGVGSAGR